MRFTARCVLCFIAWSGGHLLSGEVVVAALQDYGRALIVGDGKTHGYGTVQTVDNIGKLLFKTENPPDLGFLKVTRQRFYRPGGMSSQRAGTVSDVVLPTLAGEM